VLVLYDTGRNTLTKPYLKFLKIIIKRILGMGYSVHTCSYNFKLIFFWEARKNKLCVNSDVLHFVAIHSR
jgi:hypothetical protein